MAARRTEKGFTIVELMLATTVFSVVLMTVTAGILYMTKQYQHSAYVSRTQATATSIVQTVSNAIKYGGSPNVIKRSVVLANDVDADSRCINNREITSVLGRKLVAPTETGVSATSTSTHTGLLLRQGSACLSPIVPGERSLGAKELLANGMRLADFDISQVAGVTGAYEIRVRVVYGEDDLLCSRSVGDSCTNAATQLNAAQIKAARDLECKPFAGREYCSMSELRTLVRSR